MRVSQASRVTGRLAVGLSVVAAVAAMVGWRGRFGSDHAERQTGNGAVSGSPLRFEANRGQFDDQVDFVARGAGYTLFLTPGGATLSLQRSKGTAAETRRKDDDGATLKMHVVGGRRVRPSASDPLPGRSSYFVGNDRSKWRQGVESYARVCYPAVRPGVDIVFYGAGQRALEYDLVVAPRTDPSDVALTFEGAEAITVDAEGGLVLHTRGGDVRQPPPVAYQPRAGGARTPVAARYRVRSDGAIAFAVGSLDSNRELVIDPTLVYSTYLGGAAADVASGVAVDGAGSVYVTGYTNSTNFPTVAGMQPANAGDIDAFVTKLSASGVVLSSTYFGGSGGDGGAGVALDSAGAVYLTGFTASIDFPTLEAVQPTVHGGEDVFMTKFDPGGALVYSTYLGGGANEYANGIAVNGAGAAYVTGETESTDFPTASAAQATLRGAGDAFVTKLDASGAMVFSTYLGGTGDDTANGIAVDGAGAAYVAGQTESLDFPTLSALQALNRGEMNAFVTKLSGSGSLVYSTYLGGSREFNTDPPASSFDYAQGIAVDGAGAAYVTGFALSYDFPTTASSFQPTTHDGFGDAFVTKLSASGALTYSTFLGGTDQDLGLGIAVDGTGSAYVLGMTLSVDFPVLAPVQFHAGTAVNWDLFVTKLGPSGNALAYSTPLGGDSDEIGDHIAIDGAGVAYVVGSTTSTNFPTVAAFQATNHGGLYDGFVAKLDPVAPPAVPAGNKLTSAALALILLIISTRLLRHAQ